MKLSELRTALRVDVIGPDCSLYDTRSEFQSLNGNGAVRVSYIDAARAAGIDVFEANFDWRAAGIDDSRSVSYLFHNEGARLARYVSGGDVGKLARQLDNGKLYVLTRVDVTDYALNAIWQEVET